MYTAGLTVCVSDARWYTRAEILAVLRHPVGTYFSRRDYKKMAEIQDGTGNSTDASKAEGGTTTQAPMAKIQEQSVEVDKDDEPPFRMPASTAIAGVLIRHWAEGKIHLNDGANGLTGKGNL